MGGWRREQQRPGGDAARKAPGSRGARAAAAPGVLPDGVGGRRCAPGRVARAAGVGRTQRGSQTAGRGGARRGGGVGRGARRGPLGPCPYRAGGSPVLCGARRKRRLRAVTQQRSRAGARGARSRGGGGAGLGDPVLRAAARLTRRLASEGPGGCAGEGRVVPSLSEPVWGRSEGGGSMPSPPLQQSPVFTQSPEGALWKFLGIPGSSRRTLSLPDLRRRAALPSPCTGLFPLFS